jgi:hypothetical protein
MDTDIDRRIKAIKNLIPNAEGERLKFLKMQLSFLLKKKEDLEKSNTVSNPVEKI